LPERANISRLASLNICVDMRIVVTGALGHIGSRLIRAIPSVMPDCELVLLDNLATQRFASLFDLDGNAAYRFIELDVLQGDLEPIFRGADAVVHLAAMTDPVGSFHHRQEVERINLTGTTRVAEACVRSQCSLVHISSTSVYGGAAAVVDENDEEHLRPQSPYAEIKLSEERLLQRLGASHGLSFITCRFGTICGVSPGMRFHTAVNRFCWQAVNGQPLTVWKTALRQKRPYLDLTDAVNAIGFLIRQRFFDRKVYNVLSENLAVEDVVDMIRGHVPGLAVQHVESPIMNDFSYDVLNSRFRKLGFDFQGSVARCVAQTIALLRRAGSL
jgi:nucleoside-diphosphate-sugar epimerase